MNKNRIFMMILGSHLFISSPAKKPPSSSTKSTARSIPTSQSTAINNDNNQTSKEKSSISADTQSTASTPVSTSRKSSTPPPSSSNIQSITNDDKENSLSSILPNTTPSSNRQWSIATYTSTRPKTPPINRLNTEMKEKEVRAQITKAEVNAHLILYKDILGMVHTDHLNLKQRIKNFNSEKLKFILESEATQRNQIYQNYQEEHSNITSKIIMSIIKPTEKIYLDHLLLLNEEQIFRRMRLEQEENKKWQQIINERFAIEEKKQLWHFIHEVIDVIGDINKEEQKIRNDILIEETKNYLNIFQDLLRSKNTHEQTTVTATCSKLLSELEIFQRNQLYKNYQEEMKNFLAKKAKSKQQINKEQCIWLDEAEIINRHQLKKEEAWQWQQIVNEKLIIEIEKIERNKIKELKSSEALFISYNKQTECELRQAAIEKKQYKNSISNLNQQLTNTQALLTQHETTISNLNQQLIDTQTLQTQHETTISNLNQQLTDTQVLKTQHETTISNLNQQLIDTHALKTQHENSISNLNQQLTDTHALKTQHENSISNLNQQLTDTHALKTQHETTISDLNQQLTDTQVFITQHENSISNLNQQLTDAQILLTQHETTVSNLNQQLTKTQKNNINLLVESESTQRKIIKSLQKKDDTMIKEVIEIFNILIEKSTIEKETTKNRTNNFLFNGLSDDENETAQSRKNSLSDEDQTNSAESAACTLLKTSNNNQNHDRKATFAYINHNDIGNQSAKNSVASSNKVFISISIITIISAGILYYYNYENF